MSERLTAEDVAELFESSNRQIHDETSVFCRYLMDDIDWSDRVICIRGARGVGKTTLMLQRLRDCFGEDSKSALYVSLDDLWFARHRLKDLVGYLYDRGYTHLFIDEAHHLGKDWSLELKNLVDQYRKMNIVYSGSSLLQMERARGDLSRRQSVYNLTGLSFREYLKLEGLLDMEPIPLEKVLVDHVKLAGKINDQVKVLGSFDDYLQHGYYPFYREGLSKYRERLMETVNKVLEVDYPAIEDVSQDTIRKTRKMLMVLSESCPQTPNMSKLYQELGTGRDQGLKMLGALERSGMLGLLDAKGLKLDNLSKPEKIYCHNANLMYALVPHVDDGVKRETFFFNQLKTRHVVKYTGVGDFVVDDKWIFEVGGKKKGFGQIADLPNSFVVNDSTAVGHGNKIPLWLFGFLY